MKFALKHLSKHHATAHHHYLRSEIPQLIDRIYVDHLFLNFVRGTLRSNGHALKTVAHRADLAEKLYQLADSDLAEFTVRYKYGLCSNFKTIVHGDCWTNNFMFKYGQNSEIDDIRIVDWQLAYVGNPTSDLSNFIFTSTTPEFRKNHLDHLLAYYHQELIYNLELLGHVKFEQYPPR